MSDSLPSDADIDPAWAAESNLGWILGVNVVFHVIALGFVAARVYTKIFLVKNFGVDDALIIAAAVSCLYGPRQIPSILIRPAMMLFFLAQNADFR